MKRIQHYGNHSQLFPPYHFFLVPLAILFFALSIGFSIYKGLLNELWLDAFYYFVAGVLAITITLVMRVQGMVTQKKVIRLEMRFRYFTLTGKPFNGIENKLTTQQLAALRFASDSELLYLLDLTLYEKLSPTQIKKKIKYWKGDYYQV
jgi:hypothetical protein